MADIRTNFQDKKDADGFYALSQRSGSFVFPSQLKGHEFNLNYVPDDE
ncbi:MAG: hypothetical protein K2H35_04375 [Muribaculaceae bacterium]|nr:hypothetical protein [Muribaculaceae bacterium]MDE6558765.1 hypothetical protein [Muribaculaceae bacterium]